MNKLILIMVVSLLASSCSTTEKQLKKAIERHGAKESALFIVRSYPEYFKSDSVKIDTTLNVPIETTTPEINKDTTMPVKADSCLKYHRHIDENLDFEITIENGQKHVKYKIRPQIVRDTVKVPFKVTEPCPPCPEVTLIEEMNKELLKKDAELAEAKSKSWFQQLRDIFFYVVIAGGIVYLYLKFKPL